MQMGFFLTVVPPTKWDLANRASSTPQMTCTSPFGLTASQSSRLRRTNRCAAVAFWRKGDTPDGAPPGLAGAAGGTPFREPGARSVFCGYAESDSQAG